jgi:hypothetical protein
MGKFKESEVMHFYLDDLKGVEIGAGAHNPFGLDTINVDYIQHTMETLGGMNQYRQCGEIQKADIIADACSIPLDDKSFDFVISSHVLEHLYSPISALDEWQRIARKYIAVIVPNKHQCGEAHLSTTIEDIVDRLHLYDPSNKKHLENKHHTHWTLSLFLTLCDMLKLNVIASLEHDDKVGNGFLAIIKL